MSSRGKRAWEGRCMHGYSVRMPVAAVFENLKDGLTIDEIAQLYDGLTREQIKAVLDFANHSLEARPAAQ